jgi:hypothetical protein
MGEISGHGAPQLMPWGVHIRAFRTGRAGARTRFGDAIAEGLIPS